MQHTDTTKRIIKTRWFRISAVLLIIFLLFLVLLPNGIGYGVKRWYQDQGVEQVTIEDVDFNPFTGNLVIKNMNVTRKDRVLGINELNVRLDWIPLFSKRGSLKHIILNDANINIEQKQTGDLEVAGVTPPKGEEKPTKEEKPWGIGIESLEISNTTINYMSPDLSSTFIIKNLTLTGLSSWSPEQSARLKLQGAINKASIAATGDVYPFRKAPGYKGTLKVSHLALNPFAKKASTFLSELSGILNVDLKIDLSHDPKTGLSHKQQGRMELLNAQIATAAQSLKQERLSWDGSLQLALPTSAPLQLNIQGSLKSKNNLVNLLTQKMTATHDEMTWAGTLVYRTQDEKNDIDMQGDVNLNSLAVLDVNNNIKLLSAHTLTLKNIIVQGMDAISIAALDIDQLQLLQRQAKPGEGESKHKNLLQSKYTRLKDLKLSNLRDIDINSIELEDLLANVQITKQGKLHLLDEITAKSKEQATAKPIETKKPAIRIANAAILGNSMIQFQDNSVTPKFKQSYQINKAHLKNLDSSKPEQPSSLVLEGKAGKYSKFSIKGSLQPFTKRISLDLSGIIDDIELPPLSSYTAGKLGYNLMSGQMDADIKLKITQGKIDASNDLIINNLEVKPVDVEKMKKLTQQISVPLDSALSMLRDKNNNIKLKLPIKGDIDDPKFDPSDAINQAIGSAMKTASVSFLQYALQPYGSLITIYKLAGKAANAVRLEPLLYTAGENTPGTDSAQYLDKVASLLKERPKLRIKLCGKVTEDDRLFIQNKQAVTPGKKSTSVQPSEAPTSDAEKQKLPVLPAVSDEQLLDLAKQRSERVKDLLIEKNQIDASRLFICNPEIDKGAEAKPRVELLI